MNVLFYSVKWGQGKTTHAVWYTKYADLQLCTNDSQNATVDIYGSLFPEKPIIVLKPGEGINDIPDNWIVYDFWGFLDKRVVEVAQKVNLCVVPVYYQSIADITPAIKTIDALKEYNPNIIILINNSDPKETRYLETLFDELTPNIPKFIINKSKYISKLPNEWKTISELFDENGLNKYMLRNLLPQIKKMYSYIDKS